MASRERGWRLVLIGGLVAVCLVAVMAPLLTYGSLYLDHALDYDGICGPHAPDIAAHPCTEDAYLAEFSAGFSFMGVAVLMAVVTAVCVAGTLTIWMLTAVVYALVRRRQSVASS